MLHVYSLFSFPRVDGRSTMIQQNVLMPSKNKSAMM